MTDEVLVARRAGAR
jgi:hypothetical protein